MIIFRRLQILFLITEIRFHWLLLAWLMTFVLGALFCYFRRVLTFKLFVLFFLFDLIYLIGPEPTLILLGTSLVSLWQYSTKTGVKLLHWDCILQVMLKAVHFFSVMWNQGTFTKNFNQIVRDTWYHIWYILVCVISLLIHPFWYCILVRTNIR